MAVLATAFFGRAFARAWGGPEVLVFSFAPLALFGGAVWLARSKVGGICTVVLLALATAYALFAASVVFRGEVVDAMEFPLQTMVQALLSLVAFVGALADWLAHRFK